jgi:hypothetical protein
MWPFKKSDLPEVIKAQVLTLKPKDTLVIATDADYDGATVQKIRQGLLNTLGFDVGLLMVPSETNVFVLRSGQPIPTPSGEKSNDCDYSSSGYG